MQTVCEFVVYAKNVRSLSLSGGTKITQLLGELKNIQWDVVLLSETRSPSGTYILDGGHVLFTALSENSSSGTGILLHTEHVKKSNKLHYISDRVLALDFMAYGIKIRAIAVYAPHAGYPVEDFDTTFDQLRCVLQEGRNLKRRLVVGGDFNSRLNVGVRGAALENLSNTFGLQITNNCVNDCENHWTFSTSLGEKRRIDFIMASRSLTIKNSKATNEIDLGSDHRAVKALFELRDTRYWGKSHTPKMKGWRPYLDGESSPTNYQAALRDGLFGQDTSNPKVLEKVLYQAAKYAKCE